MEGGGGETTQLRGTAKFMKKLTFLILLLEKMAVA